MPTYEYVCANGHTFNLFQKMSDEPATTCPTCGADATRQISGGQGFVFKGSGFYITDYGKDGKGARKEGGDASASSSSDSKPEAKPETPTLKPDTSTKDSTPKKNDNKAST